MHYTLNKVDADYHEQLRQCEVLRELRDIFYRVPGVTNRSSRKAEAIIQCGVRYYYRDVRDSYQILTFITGRLSQCIYAALHFYPDDQVR